MLFVFVQKQDNKLKVDNVDKVVVFFFPFLALSCVFAVPLFSTVFHISSFSSSFTSPFLFNMMIFSLYILNDYSFSASY